MNSDKKAKRKGVSSVDVASAAGVSQATVSRVFNNKGKTFVSPKTAEKIRRVARELNYRPNIIARGLQEQKIHIIGIVNRNFESSFHMESLNHFSKELQRYGYTALMLNLAFDSDIDSILPLALQYRVDGIILTSVNLASPLVEECLSHNTPFIQFNRYSDSPDVSYVCLDNVKAGYDVADCLLQRNHRRIAYLSGAEGTSTNRDRKCGFEKRLAEEGLPLFASYHGDISYESGIKAADYLLEPGKEHPDAVFCATDIAALGFIDQCRRRYNVSIPDDISVIGFDNIPATRWKPYDLTTVSQPIKAMAEEAVRILVESIEAEDRKTIRKMVPGEVIMRSTVADRTGEEKR